MSWGWVNNLKKYFKIFIVTSKHNQKEVNFFLKKNKHQFRNIKIIYVETIPHFTNFLKNFMVFQYFYWQIKIIGSVSEILKNYKIDYIQFLSIGSIRYVPQFLFIFKIFYKVKIIIGPLGGFENNNINLRKGYSFSGYLKSIIRDISNFYFNINPFILINLFFSNKILLRNKYNVKGLIRIFKKKLLIIPENNIFGLSNKINKKKNNNFTIIYAGRIISLKGLYYFLKSIEKLQLKEDISVKIIGDGPEKNFLRKKFLNFNKKINLNWMGDKKRVFVHQEIFNSNLVILPSFHDSGGTIIHEACFYSKPVLAYYCGGPDEYLKFNKDKQLIFEKDNFDKLINETKTKIEWHINNKLKSKEIGIKNKKLIKINAIDFHFKKIYV